MMEIQIDKIKEGDNSIVFPAEDIGIIESDNIKTTEAEPLRLDIEKNDRYLHIRGKNTVRFDNICDRCAKNYNSELIINIDLVFHIGDPGNGQSDELEIIDPEANNGILDFFGYYKEAFLLSLPFISLCRDDCQGLCDKCGKDLNKGKCGCSPEKKIDPRWEKLSELLKNK